MFKMGKKHGKSFNFITFRCEFFVFLFPLVSCLINLERLYELLKASGLFIKTLESTRLLFLLITYHY